MARVKAQKGERLDDEHVERVIQHLEQGGAKKEAYGILNIKENAGRLNRIIEEYRDRQETAARIRKANRGKPASEREIQSIIQSALDGDPISGIADSLYRTPDFVKKVIEDIGIPYKAPGSWYDRRHDTTIPDKCVTDKFRDKEIVWSNHYNGLAIMLEFAEPTSHIYVIEKIEKEMEFSIGGKIYTGYGGRHAWQRNEELGSLRHLAEYGIDLYKPYKPYFENWL